MQVLPLHPQPAAETTFNPGKRVYRAGNSVGKTYPGRIPYHFPPRDIEPYVPPAPPRGRWEWIPYSEPGCPACWNGVCMCVRPEYDVTCVELPAGTDFSLVTITAKTGVKSPGDLNYG